MTNKVFYLTLTFIHFFALSFAQSITKIGYSQIGKASYYPDNREGRITAGGYKYDMNKLSAAHKYFPFGSIVKVRNIDNGKTVFLKIIDRPYTNERIIDVTLKAAQKLDIIGLNDAEVEVTLMDTPETLRAKKAKEKKLQSNNTTTNFSKELFYPTGTYTLNGEKYNGEGYSVMFLANSNIEDTYNDAINIKKSYNFEDVLIQTGWSNGQKEFRLLIGDFTSEDEGEQLLQLIKKISDQAEIKKHFN
ncbi:septal ring lytic transglycosylase RlpA family protein [Flammeovirga yaeyamensis]|uniref:Septal ring lytic transglycosylase RlpA family protein n=1 Tax=Flammeovirga yaeyamensis TaxID=367791 RepID=A0AAX1MXU3_9BACT|nr:septal ring lytic transglycosylase RlpA family protein [Flammeovirga yaeyamensis]MBB3696348.1 rare lipoprotein A (peptidoglycan hydrolase) [Flammeovirga yaeyamensis]NMF35027.1 septal ring lytic transglycosylase RlpA family protein [Flammeovirga yaeyamensis]QWG00149.1 septal ring lytic transglycosylase RlpA family protein [Flammeovirga yaeyamensis]